MYLLLVIGHLWRSHRIWARVACRTKLYRDGEECSFKKYVVLDLCEDMWFMPTKQILWTAVCTGVEYVLRSEMTFLDPCYVPLLRHMHWPQFPLPTVAGDNHLWKNEHYKFWPEAAVFPSGKCFNWKWPCYIIWKLLSKKKKKKKCSPNSFCLDFASSNCPVWRNSKERLITLCKQTTSWELLFTWTEIWKTVVLQCHDASLLSRLFKVSGKF